VFSCSERIHPSLLFSFLKHHRGLQEINNATAGSVRERLYFDKLAQIEFALPPLPEQRRIVARIEELAAQIQEARTLRQQADTEALAMIPSAMTETFRQLGEEYPTRKLTDLCDVVRGGSPRPAGSPLYYGGDIPFLKVGDLTKDDGMYVYGASATVNELGRQHSRYIEAETLMLTNSGATLGVPKITKTAGCFNDGSQAFLSLDPSVDKEFLYYLFKSKTDWFREQLARGQGQPNLNTDMTKQMDVPIPPIPKQRQIVAELDALQGEVDSLKRLQSETAAELDALLPSILDKAFKGGL
jgi:type I restriction enzyme S subunit